MSVSRRRFLKAGTVAALAAAVPLNSSLVVMAQKIRETDLGTDPLANYTQSTFKQYLNSVFRLRGGTRTVEVTLVEVTDTLPLKASRANGRESFTLLFRGEAFALPQDTYTVEHPALGTFMLFLVPTGTDEYGAQGYLATINRLEYTAKPGSTGKPLRRGRIETRPSPAPAPGPSQETAPSPRKKPLMKSLGEGIEREILNQ